MGLFNDQWLFELTQIERFSLLMRSTGESVHFKLVNSQSESRLNSGYYSLNNLWFIFEVSSVMSHKTPCDPYHVTERSFQIITRIFDAKAFHFKYHRIIPYLDNTAFHTEISIISYSVQKKYFAFSLQKILSKIRWNNRPFKISHWPFRSNHKDLFLIETAVNWSLIVHFQLQRHACNKSQMKMLSNRSAK